MCMLSNFYNKQLTGINSLGAIFIFKATIVAFRTEPVKRFKKLYFIRSLIFLCDVLQNGTKLGYTNFFYKQNTYKA